MEDSRSPLVCALSFVVVVTVFAALPPPASAQDNNSWSEPPPLALVETRIAFGVKSPIQHVVRRSPFADAYGEPIGDGAPATLVTVHRFGERSPGAVRVAPSPRPALRLGPSEESFRLTAYPPFVWNLAERVRIAFGGRARSGPALEPGPDRAVPPLGSVAIEFGDRQ